MGEIPTHEAIFLQVKSPVAFIAYACRFYSVTVAFVSVAYLGFHLVLRTKLYVSCEVSWHMSGVSLVYSAFLFRYHGVSF